MSSVGSWMHSLQCCKYLHCHDTMLDLSLSSKFSHCPALTCKTSFVKTRQIKCLSNLLCCHRKSKTKHTSKCDRKFNKDTKFYYNKSDMIYYLSLFEVSDRNNHQSFCNVYSCDFAYIYVWAALMCFIN